MRSGTKNKRDRSHSASNQDLVILEDRGRSSQESLVNSRKPSRPFEEYHDGTKQSDQKQDGRNWKQAARKRPESGDQKPPVAAAESRSASNRPNASRSSQDAPSSRFAGTKRQSQNESGTTSRSRVGALRATSGPALMDRRVT